MSDTSIPINQVRRPFTSQSWRNPRKINDEKYWRPSEITHLRTWHGRAPRREIAKSLGRTEVSVKLKTKRLKLKSPINWEGLLTARPLGAALGIDAKSAWKLLTAYPEFPSVTLYAGNKPLSAVYKRTLIRFVSNPLNWWIFYDVEKFVDKDLCRARDLARFGFDDEWVWIGDAANELFLHHKTINSWVNKGLFPNAKKYGNWRLLRSELEATAAQLGYSVACQDTAVAHD